MVTGADHALGSSYAKVILMTPGITVLYDIPDELSPSVA